MLKIIWFSTVPYSSVGYGNATREILRRFRKEGHQVKIATKHPLGGSVIVDGIECFDGGEKELINIIQAEENYDYIISMCDDWGLGDFAFNKWVNCCYLDTHQMHPKLLNAARRALYTIAMSKFTKGELEKNERKCLYAPLGVNTSTFKPNMQFRKDFRDSRGWSDDTFVIGSLGLNYSSDRKNFIGLLRAFKIFYDRHPDSILYLHTDIMGTSLPGIPLKWVINELGFNDDGTGPIQYVLQKPYHLWELSEEAVIRTYNALDVFCFPTMGEGFGLPIIEAQACGVPTIVTDTTSCKELLKGGWVIECEEGDLEFSSLGTWIMRASSTRIVSVLEEAYAEWKNGKIKERSLQAREGVLEYGWDKVYQTYWKPIFDYLDLDNQGKIVKIDKYPDYKKLSEDFGNPYKVGNCESFDHYKVCMDIKMPRLETELDDGSRPLLLSSYPMFPDSLGELYVHIKCPIHKYLAPRFVKHAKAIWEEVVSYPASRKDIHRLWEEKVKDNPEYIKLSEVVSTFDDGYSTSIQDFIITSFNIAPVICEFIQDCNSFVDVGCGKGATIKKLKELKPGAVIKGTEINKFLIDGDTVIYGDVLNLPFIDNEFDCVFSIDVLEHSLDPVQSLIEIFRVAKKKAIITVTPVENFCFEEDATHIVKWTFERWKREINEFGDIKIINPNEQLYTLLIEKKA